MRRDSLGPKEPFMKRLVLASLAAVLVVALVAGCSRAPKPEAATPSAPSEPSKLSAPEPSEPMMRYANFVLKYRLKDESTQNAVKAELDALVASLKLDLGAPTCYPPDANEPKTWYEFTASKPMRLSDVRRVRSALLAYLADPRVESCAVWWRLSPQSTPPWKPQPVSGGERPSPER
jgi:hypothetical protein